LNSLALASNGTPKLGPAKTGGRTGVDWFKTEAKKPGMKELIDTDQPECCPIETGIDG